jgi:AraC family transcriptional regulator
MPAPPDPELNFENADGWSDSGGLRRLKDHYQEVHPTVIADCRDIGRLHATLISVRQGAGDWSDPALPELNLIRIVKCACVATVDIGNGRKRWKFSPDNLILVPPQTSAEILVEQSHEVLGFAIPYQALRALCGDEASLPSDGDFGRVTGNLFVSREIVGIQERLLNFARNESPWSLLYADALILQYCGALLRLKERKENHKRGGLSPAQLRRSIEYLKANLAREVSLIELAAIARLSTFHFARSFKASTGLPPFAYQRRLRALEAQRLLAHTDLGVRAVAHAVGYATPQAFSRMFRAETGVAPLEWVRNR